MLILFSNKSLHCSVDLVGVDRDIGLLLFRIISAVGGEVASLFHIL